MIHATDRTNIHNFYFKNCQIRRKIALFLFTNSDWMRSTYVRRLIEDDRDMYLKTHLWRRVFKRAFGIRVFDQRYVYSVFIYRVFGPAPSLFLRIWTDYNLLHSRRRTLALFEFKVNKVNMHLHLTIALQIKYA